MHLGILIGRDVTLEMLWSGPVKKAFAKIDKCLPLVRSLSLPMRILFVNVFIVSIFSYIALFFVLPEEIWVRVRCKILRLFPFNGTAYPYEALVCGKHIFAVKPALKDLWAFNVSLLAVRSPIFSNVSANYFSLPTIDFRANMLISEHRDAAAVDFWRSRHTEDGTLVPLARPTSSEAYKVLVIDVYLAKATAHCNRKLGKFLTDNFSPEFASSLPLGGIFKGITSSLYKVSHAPQKLLFHQMAIASNALP